MKGIFNYMMQLRPDEKGGMCRVAAVFFNLDAALGKAADILYESCLSTKQILGKKDAQVSAAPACSALGTNAILPMGQIEMNRTLEFVTASDHAVPIKDRSRI